MIVLVGKGRIGKGLAGKIAANRGLYKVVPLTPLGGLSH